MTNSIRIIGIPMDLGQSRRGVDMGPSALRYAGLDDRLFLGKIHIRHLTRQKVEISLAIQLALRLDS